MVESPRLLLFLLWYILLFELLPLILLLLFVSGLFDLSIDLESYFPSLGANLLSPCYLYIPVFLFFLIGRLSAP